MGILVCGGRDFAVIPRYHYLDYDTDHDVTEDDWKEVFFVWEYLDKLRLQYPDQTIELICGMAPGVDQCAHKFFKDPCVREEDWEEDLVIHEFPADWEKYGKSAGYIRNKQMLDEGKPDLVIAFPGGKGTAMMVQLAKKAGIKVIQAGENKPLT